MAWSLTTNIKGATGAAGTNGTNGAKGDPGDLMPSASLAYASTLNISSYTGPQVLRLTLTGNVTSITFPSSPGSSTAYTISLQITQDTTGGRTITWPGTMKFPYGIDPVLSTAANAVDLVHFWWSGDTWWGFVGAYAGA